MSTGKSKAMNLTASQIAKLNENPVVKHARNNRISFTYEFRCELYDAWKDNQSNDTIRSLLRSRGIDPFMLGPDFIGNICRRFKRDGYPSSARNKTFYQHAGTFHTSKDNDQQLIDSGKFIAAKKGITFHPDFIKELYHAYPEQSIEEGLKAAGIDPEIVGYQRIYILKKKFDHEKNPSEDTNRKRNEYSASVIEQLSDNPFIKRITSKQLVFNDSFFNAVFPVRTLHIDEILKLCAIAPEDLSISGRNNLKYKLQNWKQTDDQPEGRTEFMTGFYRRLSEKLSAMVNEGFEKLAGMIPPAGSPEKKEFIISVSEIPEDPQGYFTRTRMLRLLGISRNCYYSILKNDDYGTSAASKKEQDRLDAETVKTVLDHKGIRKGSRQVYMQMPDLTGKSMSLKKIRRLMKTYGMETGIRKKKSSRKAMAEMAEKHKKPNLVRRRFRLHHPGELVLTDVTYLKHGNGMTSYASAMLDPVTGKLLCLNVCGHNDLTLVMESLDHIDPASVPAGAVFHSDQGTLYMTDTFQNRVSELGFIQSMSRRGNCWDNAPQESFFGHFKDELSYSDAESVDELSKRLENYAHYWNNERKQWTRNRMTPVRYEEYLNSMSEEEFSSYLRKEKERYNKMREGAVEKARKRAECLGAVEEASCQEKENS